MNHLVWLLVLACLLAIVISLGLGLYHLSRGRPEDSAHASNSEDLIPRGSTEEV